MTHYNAFYAKIDAVGQKIVPQNKALVIQALRDLGIATVSTEYEGSSDSGQLYDAAAVGSDGEHIPLPAVDIAQFDVQTDWQNQTVEIVNTFRPLGDALNDLFYSILETTHPGWEINEGSNGSFTMNVAEGTIRFQHNQRIESYETSNYDF